VFVLQPKDFWKAELKEFSSKNGYDLNRNGESGPVLLDVLEGFLKFEVCGFHVLHALQYDRHLILWSVFFFIFIL